MVKILNRIRVGSLRTSALALGVLAFSSPKVHAVQPSPYVSHVVPSSLTTQVNQLSANATTQAEKLRAASLKWALDQATYQFTATNRLIGTSTTPWVRTDSFLVGDTVTVAAPSGVAPSGTYDLQYSPLGIGDLLVQDVADNLASGATLGTINTAQYPLGLNLYPKVPNYPVGANGQPVNRIASAIAGFIPTVLSTASTAAAGYTTQQVFGHPDLPYYGDSRLVPIMFNQMESQYDTYFVIANGGGNFSNTPALAMQYLLIASRFPNLILPSVQKRWEACIYNQMVKYYAYLASSSGITSTAPVPDGVCLNGDTAKSYPNGDFRMAESMYYASAVFRSPLNHNNYPPQVANNLRDAVYSYMNMANDDAVLFPDGGYTYVYGYNECGTYHGIAVNTTQNLFVLTRPLTGTADVAANANLASMLEKARLYYPIEYPASGYAQDGAEYPAWKIGFSTSANYGARAITGQLNPLLSTATDRQLWRVFNESSSFAHEGEQMTLTDASCVDTANDPFGRNLAASKLADPDNYFLYDQNRQGPNIRMGSWMMFGSARMNRVDNRGQTSVVGCIMQPEDAKAAAGGSPAIPAKPSAIVSEIGNVIHTDTTGGYADRFTSDVRNSTMVQSAFATMATKGTMRTGGNGSNLPFAAVQEWIYTPKRMVGLSTLVQTSTTNKTYYGVGGRIQGAGTAAPGTALPRLLAGQYGSTAPYSYVLTSRIVENTFGNYVDAGGDTAELLDTTGYTTAISYPPGVVGHYVVDFHPTAQADADRAASVNTGIAGLYGLEVKEGTDMYRLLHNTTNGAITYTANLPSADWGVGTIQIHRAHIPTVYGSTSASPIIPGEPGTLGEIYRPAWVAADGKEYYSPVVPAVALNTGGTVTVTIPPNSHILLTKGAPVSPWSNLDLGTPTLVGSTLLNNGTVTVTAAGSDIWGSTDQGQFVYQTWTGDGMITARVVDLTNTNASAKAGVMFRESLAADARNAFTEVTPTKGAQFQVRLNTGSTTSAPAIVGGRAAPQWVRLVRKSGVYTSSVSTDGLTWTQLATPTSVTMTASPIYVGLAVTSHNANSRATAHFDNVTVIGPPAPPTQLAATVGSGQVTLSWMPSSSADTYAVKRATVSGGPYTTLASGLTANTYVDSTVSSGSTYYYVVTGTNALNESSNSAEASASLYIAQEVWRLSYFGTVANSGIAADTADPDGDGMTNLQEFQAGTDPVNSASVFRVSQMAAQGTDYVIGFSTVAGHVYTIQRSTDLSFNGWTTVADNLSATGSSLRWTDVGAVSTYKRVFYRVRLKQ